MGSTDRRRLLLVVHSARLGGAQAVALTQARALARRYELTIAVGHGPLRAEFAQLGRTVRQPTRLPVWGASRRRWALEAARAVPDAVRLAIIARTHRCEAIVANSTVLVAPTLAGRLAGLPVIVHAQEAPTSAAARRLLRFHGAVASTVVAISPWLTRALAGSRATVLENPVGIVIPPRRPRPRRTGRLELVVVGSVDGHKRQDLALRALSAVVAAGHDAELHLVGAEADPAYAARLRALAAELGIIDRVDFAGPSSDVPAWLCAADVLLLPAGEVTPLVAMEAMAHGTPVVAARTGSVADVVGDGGLLVPPDDPAEMARAIGRLAAAPTLAAALAEVGRRRVEARCDAARSHGRLEAELDRLIGRRGSERAAAVPVRAA